MQSAGSGASENSSVVQVDTLIDLIYTTDLEKFDPPMGIYLGERVPAVEVPMRTQKMLGALEASGLVKVSAPRTYSSDKISAVHDADYIAFIHDVNTTPIVDSEFETSMAAPVAYPFTFPYTTGISQNKSKSIIAKMGRYVFDMATPINRDTYAAALLSVECALTGADILFHENKQVAFSLCRPPGHHAMRAMAGGYSYFNNVAIAAVHLQSLANNKAKETAATSTVNREKRSRTNSGSTSAELPLDEEKDAGDYDHLRRTQRSTPGARIAILDVDFHHGNGTQEIFYDSDSVLFVSLHHTPDGAYPYFTGFDDERGTGKGEGFNINLPMPSYTTESEYTRVLAKALMAVQAYAPDYLLISLGFDTFSGDPISSFQLNEDYFITMAEHIAALGLPTLLVAEGGYAVDSLGQLAVNFLQGWKNGMPPPQQHK